jgi:hypothetical protein
MSKREQVIVVRGSITSTDALCLVSSLTGDVEVQLKPDVIYPYYCFDANCSVPTMAGRKEVSLICLVDAVNGLGATADSFELKTETIPVSKLLPVELDIQAATDIAHRTVTHRMGKKLRMIASFDVSIVPRGMVHKRFWIVQSVDARVMVDSTTGSLHPLKLRAA